MASGSFIPHCVVDDDLEWKYVDEDTWCLLTKTHVHRNFALAVVSNAIYLEVMEEGVSPCPLGEDALSSVFLCHHRDMQRRVDDMVRT